MKKAKTEAKASFIKTPLNVKRLVRKFVAKPLAYVTVFVLASYGLRQLLHTLDDRASTVLTILAVSGLCYILFIDD